MVVTAGSEQQGLAETGAGGPSGESTADLCLALSHFCIHALYALTQLIQTRSRLI